MEDHDFWRGIILYGLNAATYKMALGKSLLTLATRGDATVHWEDLSREFLQQYLDRLAQGNRPQQANPTRKTKMERIVTRYLGGAIQLDRAVQDVAREGFEDVIPRFQTIGTDKEIVAGRFYEFDFGKKLTLKDATFSLAKENMGELLEELEARWSLLEGAFIINQGQSQLANDVRETYLLQGYARANLTQNIPFLQAYQGNVCFYCSEPMMPPAQCACSAEGLLGACAERKQGEEATLAGAEDEAGIDRDIGRGGVIGRQLRSFSCEP